MRIQKPILVTGSHRSGTTWVGRMLASSPTVVYFHEPFSLYRDVGICRAQFEHWFTYLCEANEKFYYKDISDTINFRYNLIGKLKAAKHFRNAIGRELKAYGRFCLYRVAGKRPLLKDPIALFSAEWLNSRFNTDNVVMIRHPAAFAGSLKEKNWTHPFSHFLKQPLLMERHLKPFEKEIMEFSRDEKDIVDQAALLWNIMHYIILRYMDKYQDWIYMRHEDLSRSPEDKFRYLFERLKLEFSEQTAETIRSHSYVEVPTNAPAELEDLKRDSLENISSWKTRLTVSEVQRLKSKVQGISQEFYSEEEW